MSTFDTIVDSDEDDVISLKKRYEELAMDREPFLEYGELCAKATIPSALNRNATRKDGSMHITDECYQGLGKRGLLTLTGRLAQALFPIGKSFFKLQSKQEDALIAALRATIESQEQRTVDISEAREKYDLVINKRNKMLFDEFEATNFRAIANELITQLLIAGNVLVVYRDKIAKFKYYKLDEYVVSRDRYGEPLEIIIEEEVFYHELPKNVQEACFKQVNIHDRTTTYKLYTGLIRDNSDENYKFFQELNDVKVPDTTKTIPKDRSPFLPIKSDAETSNYSVSFIGKFAITDLHTLDDLERIFLEIGAAAARYLICVNPQSEMINNPSKSASSIKELQDKPNGSIIAAVAGDFSVFQIPIRQDAAWVQGRLQTKGLELEKMFMMSSGVQRDAERVTAFEFQQASADLDVAFAGLYSYAATAIQQPIAAIIMNYSDSVTDLSEFDFETVIIAGAAALGRTVEATDLQRFISQVPAEMMRNVNPFGYLTVLGNHNSIDLTRVLKTPQQVADEEEQALRNQAALAATPNLAANSGQPQGQPQ